MEKANLTFPDYNIPADKNGKKHTSADLFVTVIKANEASVLGKYTTTEFAEAVVKTYGCSNTSVNGACQFLRGVVEGSKLEFEFEFSDARPVGAVTALKNENNALKEALEKAMREIEAMKANSK
jgi:hypothetical protein